MTDAQRGRHAATSDDKERPKTFLMNLREWIDALIIAFVLAMFIRTFVVELFKIPSGSMSPTLLGDIVAEDHAYDFDAKPGFFLLIFDRNEGRFQVFRKDNNNHFRYEGKKSRAELTTSQLDMFTRKYRLEEHRIFVNKFAYWFSPPARGDIVVFRVPFSKEGHTYERNNHTFTVRPYNRNQGVYVKRAAALGGEHAEITPDERLSINGKVVEEPDIFKHLRYKTTEATPGYSVDVPKGEVMMFGDNSDNSYDSRYWGGVPYENLRGKAFLRYWPLKKLRFLN